MNKTFLYTGCWVIALLTLTLTAGFGEEKKGKFSAKPFAGSDGSLSEEEAAIYILCRNNKAVNDLYVANAVKIDGMKAVDVVGDKLDDLQSKTGHGAPWSWQELDKVFPPDKTPEEEEATLPTWKKIPILTKEVPLGKDGKTGVAGPLRLRKSAEDIASKLNEDPEEDLKDVRGATIGFSNNRLTKGDGAWNTQGALGLPVFLQLDSRTSAELTPYVEWTLNEVEGKNEDNVEELTFGLPVIGRFHPPVDYSALWKLRADPYFQTDFSGGHQIYGSDATLEYVGKVLGGPIYMGGFQNITKGSSLQYQLRVIPELDYSVTEEGGEHTTRLEGDDWFRAGGTVSLDFRTGDIEVGASYRFLETLSGSGDYSDLFSAHASVWLSKNAGITLEYTKGDTPVANQKIDLITLGLELKL